MRTLIMNSVEVSSIRRRHQVINDRDLAERLGIDRGTLSRVLAGKSAPGPVVIASFLLTFPVRFEDLFTVVDTEAEVAAAS